MKCSFCKLNYSEHNLIEFKKGLWESSIVKYICILCNKKHDAIQYSKLVYDNLSMAQIKYRFKKKYKIEMPKQMLKEVLLLNELKREYGKIKRRP
jgi:hypothetical protein